MSTTPWRDDWRYHSDWANWQDWSSSSECHDTKDAWSTPAYETPASDGVRQEPVTWTEARSSRQETPTSNNNEASGSNDAETDLNEKVKSGDVYWCDRTTPKMTMRSLRAEFHQCPTLTGNLHECVNEIIDNWTTFMLSVTFNTAQDVYFPKFKPRECGYWKKLSVEEVHQHSHSNILRMIARNKPAEDPLAICDAGSSTDRWKLTGITVREPEKVSSKFSITGDNLFSSKEICHVVNDPNLEKCDKMIFENLAPVPNYTEDEEVVTLYHTTDLSRLQDTVEHGLSTYFGVGCIDTSAIYGCPVPLGYASTVEPTWSYIQNDECMLVLLASEENAVFKRDTQRGFINPGADLYIKHIVCKSAIKSEPDNAEGETDEWTPVYCETCEHWTNGREQWKRHLRVSHPEKNTLKIEKKSSSENNDVETGGTSRASNDADAAGQQSEQVGSGATNDGEARHNTEIEHMLNVSNEKREKHADDLPPVESLNPWFPRGTVRSIGSFTMFVFTYFKGEMWILIHKMNKTKDVGNVIVSEGGSIGRTAGREYKKTMRQDIITNAEQARMLLDRNAAPFIKWQMSKSTGHCITNKARQSIVLRSSHDDSYYGNNSRIHYTYYTKCGGDFLPDLPKLARCDGYGYERGWAFKEAYQQKQMKGQMVPCDNETHAWWKAEDLYRDISEDTARRHFHESMYDIGELANRDDTTGLPGWRDHSKKEAEALIGWEDGVTVMLSNEERSCAESMHANYHKHGNIHGSVKQQVNKKMPQMPQRSDLQRSSETQEGAARELQTSEASDSPVTFDSFLRAAGVTSEHTIIVASNAADNKRSAVLCAVTKATVFSDIIPNGSLRHHDVLYDNTMVNGCPPMTKMLMALFVEKGQHPYQHMNGLSRTIRNALEDMMRKHPTSNVSTAPKDDVLQNKTLLEISEMNVLRWLIRYPLQAVTQDWVRINAHLITLNVKLFNATGQVQWLDGANVRPNQMSPNSFPWRYSLADRKWERKGHPHYRQQDSPQKLENGAKSMSRWLQSLFDNSIVEQSTHMFDVCDDCEEWQMQPLNTFEDSLPGNFVLFKFKWIADQTVDTVGTAEATKFFLGTSPLDIVPIALATGLSKIRTDAFDYEERVDNPAAYVAKGPMSRYSHARTYADPSRLFAECAPQDALDKMQELCAENAACIRTYLKCRGFRKNETVVNQRSWDTCFKSSEFRIEELWVSVGEEQDTAKAVSYFMVPQEMTCCKTAEAIRCGKAGMPHVMFNNDSLKRFHPDPENRWAVNAWDTRNAYAIEY